LKTAFGLQIPASLEEACDPAHCALILYDMQAGIVRQIPDGPAVTARVNQLLEAARAAGMRVFHTRHMSLPKQLMGVFQYRMTMAWQRKDDPANVQPYFLRDAPAFQIVPELTPIASEAVFDKLTMSAFEGTPLNMALRDCGIRSFLIAGVALEIGIDITCRHAADLGFIPVLVRDACGAGHADAAERALETLRFLGDTVIADLESVIAALPAVRAESAT
jgi:nicotinamidase-related amidase